MKEKHDGFACGGNGEIRTDVDGWYDDHSKCSPLLLNECHDYRCHPTFVYYCDADGLDFDGGASHVDLWSRLVFCACALFLDDHTFLPCDL